MREIMNVIGDLYSCLCGLIGVTYHFRGKDLFHILALFGWGYFSLSGRSRGEKEEELPGASRCLLVRQPLNNVQIVVLLVCCGYRMNACGSSLMMIKWCNSWSRTAFPVLWYFWLSMWWSDRPVTSLWRSGSTRTQLGIVVSVSSHCVV